MEKSPHIVPRVLSFFSPQPPYIKKEASAEERAPSRKAEYFNGHDLRFMIGGFRFVWCISVSFKVRVFSRFSYQVFLPSYWNMLKFRFPR